MNTIRFKTQAGTLRILIDDIDLVEIARKAESASLEAENSRKLAGSYSGRDLFDAPTMLDLLLGRGMREPIVDGGGGVPLLRCECGCPGCWDLVANIDVAQDTVRWSGFRQPHRPAWRYDGMVFEFEREQYDAALARLSNTLRPGFGS